MIFFLYSIPHSSLGRPSACSRVCKTCCHTRQRGGKSMKARGVSTKMLLPPVDAHSENCLFKSTPVGRLLCCLRLPALLQLCWSCFVETIFPVARAHHRDQQLSPVPLISFQLSCSSGEDVVNFSYLSLDHRVRRNNLEESDKQIPRGSKKARRILDRDY